MVQTGNFISTVQNPNHHLVSGRGKIVKRWSVHSYNDGWGRLLQGMSCKHLLFIQKNVWDTITVRFMRGL